MLQDGEFTPEELDKIEQTAMQEVDDAAEFALNSLSHPATLMEDVF